MLCQNCGRRSSDRLSFCPHCGAVASPDVVMFPIQSSSGPSGSSSSPMAAWARPSQARPAPTRTVVTRTSRSRTTSPAPATRSGSGSSFIIFLAIIGAAYWFTRNGDSDLLKQIRSLVDSSQPSPTPPPQPRPAPRPAQRPAAPAPATTTAPAATSSPRRTNDPAPATPNTAPAATAAARRATPPDIEGLAPEQVRQRLGPPAQTIVNNDGVTMWVYQNGVVVYLYRGRASLKPPR